MKLDEVESRCEICPENDARRVPNCRLLMQMFTRKRVVISNRA
jgi:hypothetical protein